MNNDELKVMRVCKSDPDSIACLPIDQRKIELMGLNLDIVVTPFCEENMAYVYNKQELRDGFIVKMEFT